MYICIFTRIYIIIDIWEVDVDIVDLRHQINSSIYVYIDIYIYTSIHIYIYHLKTSITIIITLNTDMWEVDVDIVDLRHQINSSLHTLLNP
mgnify:CR=1 FL=1